MAHQFCRTRPAPSSAGRQGNAQLRAKHMLGALRSRRSTFRQRSIARKLDCFDAMRLSELSDFCSRACGLFLGHKLVLGLALCVAFAGCDSSSPPRSIDAQSMAPALSRERPASNRDDKHEMAGSSSPSAAALADLQGRWQVVEIQRSGEPSEKDLQNVWVIEDNTATLHRPGRSPVEFEIRVRGEMDPPEIDMGKWLGPAFLYSEGIYRLTGDQVQVCMASYGSARPTDFEPDAVGDGVYMVLAPAVDWIRLPPLLSFAANCLPNRPHRAPLSGSAVVAGHGLLLPGKHFAGKMGPVD